MNKEKVVILGANGFVGTYLTRMLESTEEYTVIPVGKKIDVTNPDLFDLLPGNNVRAVVNLASLLRIDKGKHTPKDYIMVNGYGAFNALEYAYKVGAKMIYTHTHSDIDASPDTLISESTERAYTSPHTPPEDNVYPFILGKIMGADLTLAYDRDNAVPGAVLRLSNIRGWGSRDTHYNCVFHQMIKKAMNSEPIEIWGAHQTVRDMIYVKDVVRAIIAAINSDTARGLYCIGSGKGVTIEDEAKAIINAFSPDHKKSPLIYCPDVKEVRTKNTIFDSAKAFIDFGWKPVYSYEEAMIDMRLEMEISRQWQVD